MKTNQYFQEFKEIINDDPHKYYQDYLKAEEEVANSTAIYKGDPVKFLYQGIFLTKEDIDHFIYLTSTLTVILKKVIKEYYQNKTFRRYFNFPELMEELILIEPDYNMEYPVARFDLFYATSGKTKFCELNADGTSAMNEVRVIQQVIAESQAIRNLKTKYKLNGFELFDSWIDTIIENYKQYNSGVDDQPNIAIVDFAGEGTIYEFKEFQKRFIDRGYQTVICDPGELSYKNKKLFYKDLPIDLIYRRATTIRLIEEADQIQDFINAYRERAVCVVGGLISQIIHNKIIFAILHDQEKVSFLNKTEVQFIKDHIPFTKVFNPDDEEMIKEIRTNKDKYLLKPYDKAAAHGVYIGRDFTCEEWQQKITEIKDEDYLIQEFIEIPHLPMAVADYDRQILDFEEVGFLIGIYLYNQQFAGLYTRAGRKNIIGSIAECFTIPNYIVKEEF